MAMKPCYEGRKMLVKDVMTENCIVINEFSYLDQVYNLLLEKKVHHLPVINDDKKLVGMISDRDLRNVADNREEVPVFPRLTVSDLMVKKIESVKADDSLLSAAKIIDMHEFHCLPVVDENNYLKGIVTIRDVLKAVLSKLA